MTALQLLDLATPAEFDFRAMMPTVHSIRGTLLPIFEHIVETPSRWRAESVGFWKVEGERYWLPRLIFQRDPREEPRIKLAIFAGIHGDEPAGVQAIGDLVLALDGLPAMARQYLIHVYPLCNPTGYEDGTRHSRAGRDLNREFWKGSTEPEVQLLEKQILRERYDGLISLHSDNESDGLYGFVRGATLASHLLKPALAAAEAALPVNRAAQIDGFHAVEGIIHSAYDGILSAPPGTKPEPFEIILESPTHASPQLQRAAFVMALIEIIRHYRRLIAYAADL
ncbi:MAG TPA: succinylglutamate desuccinylase/aspartoacylase family protein [Chthoniobacteraceae bacterium]|nr:succinylglutamate desuccinylase/aspartoacylase family protein [Chthoniobacteraceae bacterium]